MSADDPLWRHPVVVRLAHAGRRLLRVDRRHPWLLDAGLIVGLLLVIGVPDVLRAARFGPSVPLVLVLQPSLALPLLWRRRAATPVFAVVVVVVLVQWSLGVWLHTDIALFVALYSVARHSPPHHLPWAAGGAFAALLVAALRVPVQVSPVVVLFFLSSAATAAAALGLALRVGRAYLVALRERATRLEIEQEQRSRLAVASERARITREMHDIIGHNLSVIIGLADGGSYAAEVRPERGGEALRLIAATGRQALGELRRILGVLREDQPAPPAVGPQPGVADLDALSERIRAAGPRVVYRTAGDLDALDRGLQLTIYRIAQESLTNALKHAGADTRVRLTLAAAGGEVVVRIEDTGPADGARPRVVPRPYDAGGQGQGIAGMRERAALYGGTLSAGPRAGGGWTVEAVLDPAPPAYGMEPS